MKKTTLRERTETLREVKERQMVWPEWMRQLEDEHGLDVEVVTHTQVTPFGNYLVGMELYCNWSTDGRVENEAEGHLPRREEFNAKVEKVMELQREQDRRVDAHKD